MVEKQNACRSAAVQLTRPKLEQMLRAMFYDDVHDADDADADDSNHFTQGALAHFLRTMFH